MFEQSTILLLGFFSILFLVAPFVVNAFYQHRAARLSDEILSGNVDEYNRQIKANALILLVRRCIWGLFFLSGLIWNYERVLQQGFSWLTFSVLCLGIMCFAFGFWGYFNELKRIKSLE